MTTRTTWLALALALGSFGLGGCGSDGGGGPPRGAGGTDNEPWEEPEPEPEEERAPEPGTCRKLCCSSADCGLDETCTALDASAGTLGYCSGTGGAIPDGSETELALPEGCWTPNQPACNPITNAGCEDGSACDYEAGGEDYETNVSCFGGDNTVGPGGECDVGSGPWCIGGFTCVAN